MLLQLVTAVLLVPSVAAKPLFLLSGQSNMIGHSTGDQSINGNATLFNDVFDILTDAGTDNTTKESSLLARIQLAADSNSDTNGVSADAVARETEFMMDLYSKGLINDLKTAMTQATCSFLDPKLDTFSQGDVNWDTNCGKSFGHELMFSHALAAELGTTQEFSSHKVAVGGSEIHRDWYPGYGQYWNDLNDTIWASADQDEWEGFFWHQGTQENWRNANDPNDEDTSLYYLGNLTDLVDAVRSEMFRKPNTRFACKEAIPVVIVQIGLWPGGDGAQRVREAQAAFAASDARAEIVISNDLCRFYHYDAPSILIMGHRIKEAYVKLLNEESSFQCPTAPSAVPTQTPATTCEGDPCKNSKDCCDGFACTGGGGNRKFCEEANGGGGDTPSAMPVACPAPGSICSDDDGCCPFAKCKNSKCRGGG